MPTPCSVADQGGCPLASRRWLAALGACLAAACGDVPTATRAGPEQPVIELLLVASRDTQMATVRYSIPADGAVLPVPRPIPADSVFLRLADDAGAEAPFAALPDSPGTYQAAFAVMPGERYHLSGTVAGQGVLASVRVPQPLVIREPTGDTLRLSESAYRNGTLEDPPFAWSAPGAAGFLVQILSIERPFRRSRIIEDTVGALIPGTDLHPGFADTSRFEVWALDTATTAFLRSFSATTSRPQNIIGALGYFGAAVTAPPKVVLWQ